MLANLMSTKRNNISLINLAFEQAKINLGSTGKNPSVGCVVEKDDSILATGHTSLNGRPHAESNALNKNLNFNGSNIFITLEPCSHFGKTPPCTNLIIKKNIKKVFFSVYDYDKRSRKKAIEIFKKKGIKTSVGLMSNFAKEFYRDYINKELTPLVDAKIAISKDNLTISKKKKWITNIHSRKRAHYLRSTYDAILSTSKSINKDNSKLNCRIEGLEKKNPAIIIIDRNLILKKNLEIYKSNKKIILFTKIKKKSIKKNLLKKKGVTIVYNKMDDAHDYLKIFENLKKRGFSRVLVESGITFLNFLVKNHFINKIYVFQSNIRLKNNGVNSSKFNMANKLNLSNKIKVNLFTDKLFKLSL